MQNSASSWKPVVLWILAVVITLAAAAYQRITGPTYPVKGKTVFQGSVIHYKLHRSHGGAGNQPVALTVPDTSIHAILHYRRYPTNESWTSEPMRREGEKLLGELPHQPPAGKMEYFITLQKGAESIHLPAKRSVVTRFKGAVPGPVLGIHIFLMFLAMLFSTRSGLQALFEPKSPFKLALWTFILLTLGGMIMGPIVQKYAFGAFWTGAPFGWDLTDNKTLIAWAVWLIALLRARHGREGRTWVVGASLVTLAVFLIPHSLLGSELKYTNVRS